MWLESDGEEGCLKPVVAESDLLNRVEDRRKDTEDSEALCAREPKQYGQWTNPFRAPRLH